MRLVDGLVLSKRERWAVEAVGPVANNVHDGAADDGEQGTRPLCAPDLDNHKCWIGASDDAEH
jgi:hypothetical protein